MFVCGFILFITEECTQSLLDWPSIYISVPSFSKFCTRPGWSFCSPNKHVYLSVLLVAWSSSPSTISCLYYSPNPRARIKLFMFIWYAWHYWNLKLLFKWQCWSSKPFNLLEGSTHWYVKLMHIHWVVLICFK